MNRPVHFVDTNGYYVQIARYYYFNIVYHTDKSLVRFPTSKNIFDMAYNCTLKQIICWLLPASELFKSKKLKLLKQKIIKESRTCLWNKNLSFLTIKKSNLIDNIVIYRPTAIWCSFIFHGTSPWIVIYVYIFTHLVKLNLATMAQMSEFWNLHFTIAVD